MGKKGKWFLAVRKIFGHEGSNEEEKDQVSFCCLSQKSHKSQRPWKFGSPRSSDPQPCEPIDTPGPVETSELIETGARHDAPPPPSTAEVKVSRHEEDPHSHAYSVALASAVAAEAAAVSAKAAAEVVRLTSNARHPTKSKEESAAIKIQTVFRGYQARIALQRLRGLVRLKEMVQGNAVQKQTTATLLSMQTLARVQSQIRSRRIRMEEENQALLKQLQLRHERELEKLKTSTNIEEDWDTRIQSKEEIEARILHRQEAAQRREKALAYAFSHQWRAPSRAVPPMFTDPANPQWGWSWLERWMAARPWEHSRTAEMNQRASLRSARRSVVTGETSNALTHQNSDAEHATNAAAATAAAAQKPIRPTSRHESPSTPRLRSQPSSLLVKKSVSPRGVRAQIHNDSRSVVSVQQSELHRRHSIAGSVTGDEESSTSSISTVFPHYLTSTTSTRAKSRFQNYYSSPETANSAKKRLSFPTAGKHTAPSPGGTRRHSDPPKVEISSVKDENEIITST